MRPEPLSALALRGDQRHLTCTDAYGPSKAAAAVETAAAAMMATTMVAAAMGTVGGGGMDNADDKTAVASTRMDTSGTRARVRRQ